MLFTAIFLLTCGFTHAMKIEGSQNCSQDESRVAPDIDPKTPAKRQTSDELPQTRPVPKGYGYKSLEETGEVHCCCVLKENEEFRRMNDLGEYWGMVQRKFEPFGYIVNNKDMLGSECPLIGRTSAKKACACLSGACMAPHLRTWQSMEFPGKLPSKYNGKRLSHRAAMSMSTGKGKCECQYPVIESCPEEESAYPLAPIERPKQTELQKVLAHYGLTDEGDGMPIKGSSVEGYQTWKCWNGTAAVECPPGF
jgi:hypothetical protein